MKKIASLAAAAVLAAALSGAAAAHADPLPGCGYDPSGYGWYNPCSEQAPWNNSNWAGVNGIPGTYGPISGYTPVTEQPITGICTDRRAACPSS